MLAVNLGVCDVVESEEEVGGWMESIAYVE